MRIEKIGFDLGDTIIDRSIQDIRHPFPDALRVVTRLVKERFGPENSFIVSKVNEEQKVRALGWLAESDFHHMTGIPEENVRFCEERFQKAPICKELSITHFVDDRPEVLAHMHDVPVPHRFLFRGNDADFRHNKHSLKGVVRVQSWKDIEKLLLS